MNVSMVAHIQHRVRSYFFASGVTDDLLFMSQSREHLQCQLYLQHSYANRERYKVSETKTKTMHFNAKSQSEEKFTFNGKNLENVQRYKHLGIIRECNSKLSNWILIEERIKMARCTVYALIGTGLHGLNGVNPEVSISMWQMYVRARLMYGRERVYLSKSDISKLQLYQRKVLRQILHLPERVASSPVKARDLLLPMSRQMREVSDF